MSKTTKTETPKEAPKEEPFKTIYQKGETIPSQFSKITVIQDAQGKDEFELFYNPAEKIPAKSYIKRRME